MDELDRFFCFYDDPDYIKDADRDSSLLRRWHRVLWSKELPNGGRAEWLTDPRSIEITHAAPHGLVRVSSDTIATTHSRYLPKLWAELAPDEQLRYERAFYTIGGFLIFPIHAESINQVRGRRAGRGDLGPAVQRLKQESGEGLWVGGVTLPLALADLGLIDEFEFLVQPVLAGHGPTLLSGLRERIELELVDRQEFRSGAVALRYRPLRAA